LPRTLQSGAMLVFSAALSSYAVRTCSRRFGQRCVERQRAVGASVVRFATSTAEQPLRSSNGRSDGGVHTEEERRFNPWDGRMYSLRELRSLGKHVSWSEAELLQHWDNVCKPVALGEAPPVPPQVEWWRGVTASRSLKHMWSAADAGHIHAISGIAYTVIGAIYLLDVFGHDVAALAGEPAEMHFSRELAVGSLALGAFNAASGMQPALLARSVQDLPQILGLGPNGNLKSGGFVNTCVFFFILAYQSLRVLPSFPAVLAPMDHLVGLVTLAAIWHTMQILDGWVRKDTMHRVDSLLVPSYLNLPVALHLLLQGPSWLEQLTAAYPGFPEVFFTANYALAWSLSMVTFLVSLKERKVISEEIRNFLMLSFPALVFIVIPVRVALLVPEWFQDDIWNMLTLNPPSS